MGHQDQDGEKVGQMSLFFKKVIEDIMPFVLNTKWPLSDIWLLSYKQISFGCFLTIVRISILSKNTQNCFAYNSATKYRSEAILYSKRTVGYPLSPHINRPHFFINVWHLKIRVCGWVRPTWDIFRKFCVLFCLTPPLIIWCII